MPIRAGSAWLRGLCLEFGAELGTSNVVCRLDGPKFIEDRLTEAGRPEGREARLDPVVELELGVARLVVGESLRARHSQNVG